MAEDKFIQAVKDGANAIGLSALLTTTMPGMKNVIEALKTAGVRVIEPLPYIEFVSLVADSRMVLTDSGGIQEETTVLGVPCLTLRDSTERPVTVTHGTNWLVGADPRAAVAAAASVLAAPRPSRDLPPMWDGRAAERIVEILSGREWRAYGSASANGSASR